MDSPKTFKPGDHVASLSFVLVFIDGSSLKGAWHEMMTVLVNAIEMSPRNITRIGWKAAFKWTSTSKHTLDSNIRDVRVKISNNTFSRKSGDRIKTFAYVHLTDFDGIQSMLTFEVKKKPEMKMLQTLAAETILSCISKKEDVKCLEVPKELLRDLNKAYDEIWRVDGRSISLSKSCSPSRHRPSIMKNTGDVASEAEAVLRRRSIHSLYHRLYGFCCIIEY